MPNLYTRTGDLNALVGAVQSPEVFVRPLLPSGEALIDSTNKRIKLGSSGLLAVASDGTFSVELVGTDSTDLNVEAGTWSYQIVVKYVDPGTRERQSWSRSFALTSSGDFADAGFLGDLSPLAVQSSSAYALEAKQYRDEAAAARQAAEDLIVADLGTTDGQTRALIKAPASQTAQALSATYARRGAPGIPAPLLIATPVTLNKAGTKAVSGYNPATGTYYGTDTANGHYITSTDLVTWTDRTYSPSVYTPGGSPTEFDETYMYAQASANGRLWRAPLGVFNDWTEITVSDKGPLTNARPGSLCALGDGVLLFGNYTSGAGDGAHIWRSTNAGTSWTKVLTIPAGKHVHSIRRNPADGTVWASLGDAGFDGIGLWKSTDDGATWTLMSSNEYGIDMVFVPAAEGRPALVVLEGDGLNRPHLVAFPQDGEPGDKTFPLVWFTGAPSAADTTRGTTRGIGLTPANDIIYWVTTEGGVVGSKAGLYVAQAPDYTRSILLAETTGAEPVTYSATFVEGSVTQNYLWTLTTPTFGSY